MLRLDDPPWRVALALAVGVFISCTPFYGLQTLLSLAVATVCRLNRAVTVTGAWLNLPWFAPLVYGFALRIGALVLPDLHGADVAEIAELLQVVLGSFSGRHARSLAQRLAGAADRHRGRGDGGGRVHVRHGLRALAPAPDLADAARHNDAMKARKAVFPAAGLGTRFLPATKAQPKEMLPLVDKPMIQYVVEEAVASGSRRSSS